MNLINEFPILKENIYLDSAASCQKPLSVLKAMYEFDAYSYANVHRGAYTLAEQASMKYDEARLKVAQFLQAKLSEIAFTHGTTHGINLVAQSYAKPHLKAGDEVWVSALEHHSNLLPWMRVCEETGAVLKIIPLLDSGEIDLEAYEAMLNQKGKILALTHLSNAIGTLVDVKTLIALAKRASPNIKTLVDGAQWVAHHPTNVKDLGVDFYVFSGHKIYGPTGIGALYIKEDLIDAFLPYELGGGMIETVSYTQAHYLKNIGKLEAGTPPITQAIGLGAALDWLKQWDFKTLLRHESALLHRTLDILNAHKEIRVLGSPKTGSPLVSFVINKIHPHDFATIANTLNVCIRAGHVCAEPLVKNLKIPAIIRVSFGVYNTLDQLNVLNKAILNAKKIFKV